MNIFFKPCVIAIFLILFLCHATVGQDLPPALANSRTIPAGSLVIAMDNTNQALTAPFNIKAYGLVNKLLQNSVPVMWSIRSGKAKDGVDFSVNASRVFPTAAAAANLNFAGGPFIVHRDFVPQAGTLISTFGNNVAVYRLNADVSADVRYILSFKPKPAVASTNSDIHTKLYDFALIPEYFVIAETAINSTSCYTTMSHPHTSSTAAITGIKGFVQSGGNFTAQCLALATYENAAGGRFMTTNGITISNVDTPFSYPNPDMAFGQFIGVLEPKPGGSEQDWSLAGGSSFANGGHIIAQNSGAHADKFAAMVSKLTSIGRGGMTFYLGGHDYGQGGNSLGEVNGQRMVLNAVLVPPSRPLSCNLNFPGVVGYKSVKVTADATGDGFPSSGDTLTWTIDYVNVGSAPVTNFQVADTLPAGITFQSLTVTPNGAGTSASANPSFTGAAGSNNLLSAGAALEVDGKITIAIETKVNSNFIGTLANQGTGTGTGLPPAGFKTDNVDNAATGLLGSVSVPSASHAQTKNDATVDPTTIQIFAPSEVQLERFDAGFNGRAVVLEWSTASETNNLGFNIYRQVGASRELVNQSPIAGNSLRSSANLAVTGESYRWVDEHPLEPGTIYYLEDMDMWGNTTLHGPVAPRLRFSADTDPGPNRVLLSELSRAGSPSAEREIARPMAPPEKLAGLYSTADQNRQWQIAAGGGVKISVNRDGWHRVPADQLRSAGFETDTDRTDWRLFADSEEVPLRIGPDGSVEFYGRGLDVLTSDTRIYYLIKGDSAGARVKTVRNGKLDRTEPTGSFPATIERKDRTIYASAILNGEKDNWFGPLISLNTQTVQDLTVHNPDDSGQATLRIILQGLTSNAHRVIVGFNGRDLGTVEFNDRENRAFEFQIPAPEVIRGQNRVTLQAFGTGNDLSLVDAVSLTYPRRYTAVDDSLRFSVPAGRSVRVGGFTEGGIELFEVRNNRVSKQIEVEAEKVDGTHGFSLGPSSYEREFIAVRQHLGQQPRKVERDRPSAWHSSANTADLVIITPDILYSEAEQLAKMRNGQGLKTEVVPVEDLYDEFSFGVHSPDAVRRFLERSAGSWKSRPQYAILFGDSSFDPRNYLAQADQDLIPTRLFDTEFMETASDTWLADFNDDGIEDIGLGRIPVADRTEAGNALAKLARYDRQPERRRSSNLLIADRGFEGFNQIIQNILPAGVDTVRIERSAMSDAKMHESVLTGLNAGPKAVTYTGHGASGLWSGIRVFSGDDAARLNNPQMSLYLLMTCLNGFTHNPYNSSMAEALFKQQKGGGVLVWASSGSTYPDPQFAMTRAITGYVFDPKGINYRIGDMTRAAKQATSDQSVRRTWQLIGDPTLVVR